MVLSSEGYFYSYNIDLENGGECSLTKQYRCVLRVFSGTVACADAFICTSLLDSNDETVE